MKNVFLYFSILFLSFFSVKSVAQIKSQDLKSFYLEKEEYKQLINYLISKNLEIKDRIFIKYDFNGEDCWNYMDGTGKKNINNFVLRFQSHIKKFNDTYETAVAYNFRQPGKDFNKLKLWDDTIIIDDREVLKKLIFKNKTKCGSSVLILNDGSYVIYEGDSHFALLRLQENYSGEKF